MYQALKVFIDEARAEGISCFFASQVKSRAGEFKQVYLAQKAADELKEMRPSHKGPVVLVD